eukprot:TRINITY_DN38209_c0_g1_i1.p1 TRINITY_DN38209_c0_g1~~TRINITY_DN38209_c0_g1_i1.p1  ORF type:complete len:1098 (-),score=256.73 TRINITY_DN38209_c0_g1_i1:136-3429(-)
MAAPAMSGQSTAVLAETISYQHAGGDDAWAAPRLPRAATADSNLIGGRALLSPLHAQRGGVRQDGSQTPGAFSSSSEDEDMDEDDGDGESEDDDVLSEMPEIISPEPRQSTLGIPVLREERNRGKGMSMVHEESLQLQRDSVAKDKDKDELVTGVDVHGRGRRGSDVSVGSVGTLMMLRKPSAPTMREIREGVTCCLRPSQGASWVRKKFRLLFFHSDDDEDQTPRVWGNAVKSARSLSRPSDVNHMVERHMYQEEMKLQLRDERVRFSYVDAFQSDGVEEQRSGLVRVFTSGATKIEYLKTLLGVWSFITALTVIAFWDVLRPLHRQAALLAADCAADAVYAMLLVVQLRTSILDVQSGREFCSPRRVLHAHLADHRFWVDVISCVPMIALQWAVEQSRATVLLLKALRGWRILRTPPEHHFVPSTTYTLAQLMTMMMMGAHFLACAWFMLVHDGQDSFLDHIQEARLTFQSYKACGAQQKHSSQCFWVVYLVSLHQGLYLLLGIDRDAQSAAEHLFITLCTPLGVLVHAYLLGEIVLLISRRGALETKRNEHTLAIREAMRIIGLPPHLQMRIITFFTYERLRRSGRLVSDFFADLSPQLRFELQLHLYLDLVRKSGLFRLTRPRVIRDIVVHLEDVIFQPGDWVCRYGDYGDSMYFIVDGLAAVLAEDTTTQLKVLQRGSYFGEVALLMGVPRTAYVRADTFCIMAQLTKDGFAPILRKWPEEIDVLISGIDKEGDRAKIKAEALKLYGLRRVSIASGAMPGLQGNRRTSTHHHHDHHLHSPRPRWDETGRRDSTDSLGSDATSISRSGGGSPSDSASGPRPPRRSNSLPVAPGLGASQNRLLLPPGQQVQRPPTSGRPSLNRKNSSESIRGSLCAAEPETGDINALGSTSRGPSKDPVAEHAAPKMLSVVPTIATAACAAKFLKRRKSRHLKVEGAAEAQLLPNLLGGNMPGEVDHKRSGDAEHADDEPGARENSKSRNVLRCHSMPSKQSAESARHQAMQEQAFAEQQKLMSRMAEQLESLTKEVATLREEAQEQREASRGGFEELRTAMTPAVHEALVEYYRYRGTSSRRWSQCSDLSDIDEGPLISTPFT